MKKYNYAIVALFSFSLLFFTGCEESEPELLVDLIVPGEEPPGENCDIGHRTQTPGGWGAPAAGNNPGALRDAYFDQVFPDGLLVGCPNGYYVRLTSAAAVEDFLPSGGKPRVLDQIYIDPSGKELKNVLAGHLVALTLSLHFDHFLEDFGESEFLLCDLILCSGQFPGNNVQEVMGQANRALGGCPSQTTIVEAIELISSINENFVDGTTDNGVLCCPRGGHISTLDNDQTI
ncbi:MAG: hypothetical protein DHS20C17_18740 [Cyclobacteriaceae bacterium]|nr:MAG: hypothetical protein DHS20C17_18740 [Cyclobacteriaceae bacterium]